MKQGLLFLFTGLTVAGCSLLSKDTREQLPAGGFRGTAAIRANTVPLPVEIAEDIDRITEEAKVEHEEDTVPLTPVRPKKPTAKHHPLPTTATVSDVHPLSARPRFSRNKRESRGNCDCSRSIASSNGKSSYKNKSYKVRPGDTLMKIAFAKYGDILRWREIYESNRELLVDFNKLEIGSILVIHNVEFVVIERNGEPYLIRKGDTLGKISHKLYGTTQRWRDLWQNNRQLIRNPHQIYAGFTIYYIPAHDKTKVK